MSATLHRENIEKLEEYVISAINLGAKILKVGAADLFGREKRKTSLELDYVEKKSELAEKILRVKKKYHSKINVLLNNIEIEEHIDNGKELLYRRNLKCGSGIDYVVISSKGSIRPCLYFDEEEISIGTISLLSDYINDGYEIEHLYQAIKNIFESGFYKDNSVSPCWALKKYYEEYIMEDKS